MLPATCSFTDQSEEGSMHTLGALRKNTRIGPGAELLTLTFGSVATREGVVSVSFLSHQNLLFAYVQEAVGASVIIVVIGVLRKTLCSLPFSSTRVSKMFVPPAGCPAELLFTSART